MLNEILQPDIPRVLLNEIKARCLDLERGKVPTNLVRIAQHRVISFVEIPDNSATATLHNSPSGVLSQNRYGIINYNNPRVARMLGYKSLVGIPSIDLVPEEYREARAKEFEEVLRTGIPIAIETQRIHRLGHEIDIAAQVFRYKSSLVSYGTAAIIKRN